MSCRNPTSSWGPVVARSWVSSCALAIPGMTATVPSAARCMPVIGAIPARSVTVDCIAASVIHPMYPPVRNSGCPQSDNQPCSCPTCTCCVEEMSKARLRTTGSAEPLSAMLASCTACW